MIPRDYVTSWRAHAPWATDAQVEQDLASGQRGSISRLTAHPASGEEAAQRP